MLSPGRIAPPDVELALTAAGEELFRPLWSTVSGITEEIHDGLAPADVEATRRTLAEMTRRATARLASTDT